MRKITLPLILLISLVSFWNIDHLAKNIVEIRGINILMHGEGG